MNIKETINYLQEFEVKMTAPGLRAAIRRGEIGGASKKSEKGEIDISISSVLEYALNKTHNRFAIYRAGYEVAKRHYENSVIQHDLSSKKLNTFLFEGSIENQYHYLINNPVEGFIHLLVKIDWSHSVIHLKNDLSEGGMSAEYRVNVFIIKDILSKFMDKCSKGEMENTKLFIYTGPINEYSTKKDFVTYSYDKVKGKFDYGLLDEKEIVELKDETFANVGVISK